MSSSEDKKTSNSSSIKPTATSPSTSKNNDNTVVGRISRIYSSAWLLIYILLACSFSIYAYHRVQLWKESVRLPLGRYVEVDGGARKLHLFCRGIQTAEFTFVVPDLAQAGWYYGNLVSALSLDRYSCTYDRAGLGYSSPLTSQPNISQMVEDLHSLLQNAGFWEVERAKVTLVGEGFGATIVLAYLQRYGHRTSLRSVVFLNPSIGINATGAFGKYIHEQADRFALLTPLAEIGFMRVAWALKLASTTPPRYMMSEEAQFVFQYLNSKPKGNYHGIHQELSMHLPDESIVWQQWQDLMTWNNLTFAARAAVQYEKNLPDAINSEWRTNTDRLRSLFEANNRTFEMVTSNDRFFMIERAQETYKKFVLRYLYDPDEIRDN